MTSPDNTQNASTDPLRPRGKSVVRDEDFESLEGVLWEQYLEWCNSGYVVRDNNGRAVAISTKPSVRDFVIWKQTMGYYTDEVNDG